MRLKLYYDTDIATLTYKGSTFANGQDMDFSSSSTSNDFVYTLKNGNLNIGGTFAVVFWSTNTYLQGFNASSATTSFSFSQHTVTDAFSKNQNSDTSITCEPFLVMMSSNFNVSGHINQVRSTVAGGNFKTKTVTRSGANDIITVDYGDKYKITSAKFYYRDPVTYGHYEDVSNDISTDKHKISITVPRDNITSNGGTGDVFAYFVLPELTKVASADINVKYSDGVNTQTISYPDQTAGKISGSLHAASGYKIKNVTSAWYRNLNTGMQVTLSGFTATKVSDTEYSFSLTLTDTDIKHFEQVQTDYIHINLTTEKDAPVIVSADINVKYSDGVTTQTLSYPKQTAGKISGDVHSATGYTIKSVTRAWYLNPSTGLEVNLGNFTATKVSNYKYSFSFDVTDTNLNYFKNNPNDYITISLTTEKEKGNITVDASGLANCSVTPSTITQDTETKITLSADLGYILNGSGSYTVDGKQTSFMCNNVESYSFTVTANAALSISFTATKVETKPASISHTYILDQDGYNNLGKQFIQAVNTNGDGFAQYDYSKFVNYLYQIPFTVPDNFTKPSTNISIGKTSLNVPCTYVTHETLTVDLGEIDLPATNSIDYNVLGITLYAPYTEKIELPKSVLGSKIKLVMQVNLLNESATLIVSQNDTVIFTCGTQVFTDLPLYFTAGTKDILVKTFKTRYQNTINQAYIKISFNKPIDNLTRYQTNEHGKLSDYQGFTRVTHGTLKNSISQEIDRLIIEKLTQGVIIK